MENRKTAKTAVLDAADTGSYCTILLDVICFFVTGCHTTDLTAD
jgi:hypothetical protein